MPSPVVPAACAQLPVLLNIGTLYLECTPLKNIPDHLPPFRTKGRKADLHANLWIPTNNVGASGPEPRKETRRLARDL